tara:strand:- start:1093 stop:1341 length:249 start_codon:yes stop_codon:yes gene_type:complete
MKLTARTLRRMINEEMANIERSRRARRLAESRYDDRPVRVTPAYINRIIREEYEAHQERQRLSESRRRRIANARRRRDLSRY